MTVSSPVRSEIFGRLRKNFHGRASLWTFRVTSDGNFLAEGGLNDGRKICKSREELRHLWSMMIGYGFTQV